MIRFHPEPESPCCPFIDRDDSRCASQFKLGRLHNAFGVCINEYQRCATYHQILRESEAVHTIPIAINGRIKAVNRVARLRPTGT